MLLKNYLKDFEFYMMNDNSSQNTINNYLADVEKMLVYLKKEPNQIERMDIVNYINQLRNQDQELNAKTINRKIYAVYKFTQYLNYKCGLNLNLNVKKLKMRIEKQEYARNMLSKTDFKRILNAAEKDNNWVFYTLLLALYLTGMRISEALNLKVKDSTKKEILVTGKGRKQRYVFPPDRLRKQFKIYLSERNSDSEYIFLNKNKDSRLTEWMADYWIKKYARQTKVDIKKAHCHNIRHLFCYICINERGKTVDETAQLAGHSDINVTAGYTLKTKKQLIDDVKNFDLD